jgi:hypothetical protein
VFAFNRINSVWCYVRDEYQCVAKIEALSIQRAISKG